jgi:acyl-CoA dehydrogenase
MAFEVSEKTQAMLDMINEFMDKEVYPIEREFFEKDFAEIEPELEKKYVLR